MPLVHFVFGVTEGTVASMYGVFDQVEAARGG